MTASSPAPPGIFISYRRQETAPYAGWLANRLADHFGGDRVFKDIDSIQAGDNFTETISAALASCQVLLALIGDQWLTIADRKGRRGLDKPKDFVRLEIEAALSLDIRIIPILIDGARMPRAGQLPSSLAGLAARQALELTSDRFDFDFGRLLKVLDRVGVGHAGALLSPEDLAGINRVTDLDVPLEEVMSSFELAALKKIKDPEERRKKALTMRAEKARILRSTLEQLAGMRRDMSLQVIRHQMGKAAAGHDTDD